MSAEGAQDFLKLSPAVVLAGSDHTDAKLGF